MLVIGDLHVPHRSSGLPAKFKKLLVKQRGFFLLLLSDPKPAKRNPPKNQVPGKIQHILCTGNLVNRDTFDFLKSIANDVHVVKGDFDEVAGMPFFPFFCRTLSSLAYPVPHTTRTRT